MIDPASSELDETTGVDRLLDGKLTLRQSRRGHRAGTDAVLLAAAAGPVPGEVFIDVGAGVGTVGLALALQQPQCRGVLLEADPAMSALAGLNAAGNALESRVSVCAVDLFDRKACLDLGLLSSASLVVTNPPFYRDAEVRSSPERAKADAHVLRETDRPVDHGDWLRGSLGLLRPHGRFLAIHRPEALPSLLRACEGRLGSLVLCAIHPKAGKPAVRILIGGRLDARGPLTILSPLTLHRENGAFTEEADRLNRGEPMPFWQQKSRPRGAGFSDR